MAELAKNIVFQVMDLVAGGSLTFIEGPLPKGSIPLDRGFLFHAVQDRTDGFKTAVLKGVCFADIEVYGPSGLAPGSTEEMVVEAVWINGEAADQTAVQKLRRATIAKIGGRVQDSELLGMAEKQEKAAAAQAKA